ncbi:hypothetical protein [Streptomyces noursei]|uniref:hypothetical protein n=1 Tax=Streptomyces noursei TaxID=1971 RepID=UPI00045EE415|nr:hypothetical protein [Streptomyces noursei]AIA00612.1 hypothetical protein DC74_84 [Streptomyces noursei]
MPVDLATLIGIEQTGCNYQGPGLRMRAVGYELASRRTQTVLRLDLANRPLWATVVDVQGRQFAGLPAPHPRCGPGLGQPRRDLLGFLDLPTHAFHDASEH